MMNLTPTTITANPKTPKKPFILGQNNNSDYTIGNKERFGNTLIIGSSQSGKTNLMVNMFLQDVENSVAVCYFDPTGETVENILKLIPEDKKESVLLLTPDLDYDELDFDKAIADSKIILIQALVGRDGVEKTKKFNRGLVGRLIDSINKRNTTIFNTRPFFVYIDELAYVISDKVVETIETATKHNISLILSAKNLGELEKHDTKTRLSLEQNCLTKIIFDLDGPQDIIQNVVTEIGTDQGVITELPKYSFAAKINKIDSTQILNTKLI
jgi:hypothetical protein